MLEISDLVCCYGKVEAIKGISLSIKQGQLVALIGANGAGKSTTLAFDFRDSAVSFRTPDVRRPGHHALLGARNSGARHCPLPGGAAGFPRHDR